MDFLLSYYTDKIAGLEGNIFEMFTQFYSFDLSPINSWLKTHFQNKVLKDDTQSVQFRQEGNQCYARKELVKCLQLYTKSMCFATLNSKEYGLALANRSAAFLELKEYRDCITDIELCFKSNYPKQLRPKVYMRKAECYIEMGQKDDLNKCIYEALKFLRNESIPDKDKFISKLNELKASPLKMLNTDNSREKSYDIPALEEGENENFAYASSKIKMSYDKTRGRHVVSTKNIKRGDVLFVEKAFICAPVFKDNKEFIPFKCYYCLKDVLSSVPCHSCTLCIYCNDKCRLVSWKESHKWECEGMQANIWYEMGIGFPTFKSIMKGVKSGFRCIKGDHEEDLKHFGNKQDNYPYFSRLMIHIYKNKNAALFFLVSTIVVTYLKNYTDFFVWYLKQEKCPKKDLKDLENFIGGLITKHIAQMTCNSSIIEHWTCSSSEILLPDVLISTACGMFPSVSIMNHSCRPNVSNFFICDTIVVKALEDISENQEIFNCYGVDYRTTSREERQKLCRSLYHFECKCEICSDELKEMDLLDGFNCPECRESIKILPGASVASCRICKYQLSAKTLSVMNNLGEKCLEAMNVSPIEALTTCLNVKTKILYKHHKDFEDLYYRLYDCYLEMGDTQNMLTYFQLYLEHERVRRGKSARAVGVRLYEAALTILHCLKKNHLKSCSNLMSLLQNVNGMIREAKDIINLYYPPYITNKLNNKIKFIQNKQLQCCCT
ncbi:SET and MYND domain-containing protein 4-like [Euwallacea similis]|uniref:SET and MYND domain-containing protein 4-like n=1 Tax=Euwallacea similis TaxID=1736056 RepID=UPI00344FC6E6